MFHLQNKMLLLYRLDLLIFVFCVVQASGVEILNVVTFCTQYERLRMWIVLYLDASGFIGMNTVVLQFSITEYKQIYYSKPIFYNDKSSQYRGKYCVVPSIVHYITLAMLKYLLHTLVYQIKCY